MRTRFSPALSDGWTFKIVDTAAHEDRHENHDRIFHHAERPTVDHRRPVGRTTADLFVDEGVKVAAIVAVYRKLAPYREHRVHLSTLTSMLWIVGVIWTSGCGGGSGGAEKSSSTTEPTPVAAAPFRFSNDTASDGAAATFAMVGNSSSAANVVLTVANLFTSQKQPTFFGRCTKDTTSPRVTASWVDRDGDGRISRSDLIELDHSACKSGFKASLDIRSYAADFWGIKDVGGDLTFSWSIPVTDAPGTEIEGSFSLGYRSLESTTVIELDDVELEITTADVVSSLTEGYHKATIDHGDQRISVGFSGSIEDNHLQAAFRFDTTGEFVRDASAYPTTGELTLLAGTSKVRLAARGTGTHREEVLLAVDSDGDGHYADETEVRWDDLIPRASLLFDFFTIPRGVYIHPFGPTIDDNLVVLVKLDEIAYGERLNYRLYRNGERFEDTNLVYSNNTSKGEVWEARVSLDSDPDKTWTATATIWNSPPEIVANLVPERPDTADDITVIADVTDLDDHRVPVSYAWRVNEEAVGDVQGATLPSEWYARDDVVTVAVGADDGEAAIVAKLETVIADAMPRVTVNDPPDSVAYGDQVAIDLAITDADGDPVPPAAFRLHFGPAGMSVDSESGRLTWTATDLPMFDKSMDVHWRVGATDNAVVPVSGTIRLVDEERRYPIFRTGRTQRSEFSRLAVADFNGDGNSEVLTIGINGPQILQWSGNEYVESWAYPFVLQDIHPARRSWGPGHETVAHGDVDGDGRHEIFTSVGRTVAKLDGVDRRLTAAVDVPDRLICTDLEVADTDRDGWPELLCIASSTPSRLPNTESRVVLYSATDLRVLWESEPAVHNHSLIVGNVDTDAALEIVTAGGYVYDGTTLALEWRFDEGFGNEVRVADLDGDGIDEIIGRRIFSAAERRALWDLPPGERETRVSVGDIVGGDDGRKEVAVWHGLGPDFREPGFLKVYRYDDAQAELTLALETPLGFPRLGYTSEPPRRAMEIGDLDGDGRSELTLARRHDYGVVDFKPKPEWIGDARGYFETFIGGQKDFPDFASAQLLFATNNREHPRGDLARIVPLSPQTGRVSTGSAHPAGGPLSAVTTDYDQDGSVELIVARKGNSSQTELWVFDPAMDQWWELVRLPEGFRHPRLAVADVNGDGYPDVLMAGRSDRPKVLAVDAFNREFLLDPQALGDNVVGYDVTGADLDLDGRAEIIVATDGREDSDTDVFVVFSPGADGGEFTRATYPSGTWGYKQVLAGDFDGDGTPQVLLYARQNLIMFDANFQRINSFDITSDLVRQCEQPTCTHAGLTYWGVSSLHIRESLSGNRELLVALGTGEGGLYSRVIAYDPSTGGKIWESPVLLGVINNLHAMRNEGRAILSLATSRGMYLTR